MTSTDFLHKLRKEIELGQAHRQEYCIKKLTFTSGLLGLGSLGVESGNLSLSPNAALWLAPAVALAFDLYITSEDFGVKRAGAFLSMPSSGSSKVEQHWESHVVHTSKHSLPTVAMYLVTHIVLVGALLLLVQSGADQTALGIWAGTIVTAECFLYLYAVSIRKQFSGMMPPDHTSACPPHKPEEKHEGASM